MSTTIHKAQKRARRRLRETGDAGLMQTARDLRFEHPVKTPTPVAERSFVTLPVIRTGGDAHPAGMPTWMQRVQGWRSPARALAFIQSGGIKR